MIAGPFLFSVSYFILIPRCSNSRLNSDTIIPVSSMLSGLTCRDSSRLIVFGSPAASLSDESQRGADVLDNHHSLLLLYEETGTRLQV